MLTLTTPEGGHLLSKEASAQLTPPLGLPVEDIYPGITSGTSCTNVVALSVAHKAALPLPTAVMPLSVAQETVEEGKELCPLSQYSNRQSVLCFT